MTKILLIIVKILNNCIILHEVEAAYRSMRQTSLGTSSWGSLVLEGSGDLLTVKLAEVTSKTVLLTTAMRVLTFKIVFFNYLYIPIIEKKRHSIVSLIRLGLCL